eukprot:CAMPEP_0198256646 /NCGR_PEP_ID=MMETSP1447-20131203/6515_1 /TAXON_ID=420782 /ORGANISM="Chaetoceros dichaeta, Strain CCMP1751" /LENGTH=297 /DNA_ID=CAMNT_0043943341 /DNA_START=38 /DNA_END=931 /DNA_ORIENTATION=-
MTSSSNDDNILRISKHLLLSSPPGQFDVILSDLLIILSEKQKSLLDSNWIQQVQTEYESRSGKSILRTAATNNNNNNNTNENDDDCENANEGDANDDVVLPSSSSGTTTTEMERSLEEQMKKYLETYYSSKGVTSNVQITTTTTSGDGSSSTFIILLYAERIQLPQYHAGSWLARYTITLSPNLKRTMDGTVLLHAHTFENGNVQMTSKTTLGPITVDPPPLSSTSTSTAAHGIVETIQAWEEDHVVTPLREAYDSLGSGVLKKLRRVMPVTRTKFDWNVASHRLHKGIGIGIEQNK